MLRSVLKIVEIQFGCAIICLTAILQCGCAGYQIGNQGLYRFDVSTVHVPIFQSDSLRRFLGERLTEAVVKEIELRTPYKVTTFAEADSVIQGKIITDRKRVVSVDQFDNPRNLSANIRIEVAWTNRNNQPLFAQGILRIDDATNFIPEAGQSITTAQQEVINQIAREIVNQMEIPSL